MLKNLVLAILIAVVLSYSLGYLATEYFDFRIQINQQWIEPLMATFIVTAIVALLVIIGFAIALSVFGALFFVIGATFLALFITGVTAFWPIVLGAIVIYYLVRDKTVKSS